MVQNKDEETLQKILPAVTTYDACASLQMSESPNRISYADALQYTYQQYLNLNWGIFNIKFLESIKGSYLKYKDEQNKKNPSIIAEENVEFWREISRWCFDLTKNLVVVVSIGVAAGKTELYLLYIPAFLLGAIIFFEFTSQIELMLEFWFFVRETTRKIAKTVIFIMFASTFWLFYYSLKVIVSNIK